LFRSKLIVFPELDVRRHRVGVRRKHNIRITSPRINIRPSLRRDLNFNFKANSREVLGEKRSDSLLIAADRRYRYQSLSKLKYIHSFCEISDRRKNNLIEQD